MFSGRVYWSLLGDPDVVVDGVPIDITRARSRAVMILLVTRAGQRVPTSRIIDELWPDATPRSARNSVQRFVSDLRMSLGAAADRVETVPDGYRLRLGPSDGIDTAELEVGVRLARRHATAGQHAAALAALAPLPIVDGDPIPGLNDEQFVVVERERLAEMLNEAAELELDCLVANGDDDLAVRAASRLIERSPFRDAGWVGLATSQYRQGRSRKALDSLRRHRVMQRDELGLDPSPTMSELERRILNHDPELSRRAPTVGDGSRAGAPGARHDGAVTSPVIGRSGETEAVGALLARHRVVTITGTGGIGKTSLAREAAYQVGAAGRTVRFVELADTSASGVVGRIGEVVGTSLRADRDTLLEIVDRLQAESALLVLDNCEHLRDEVATVLDTVARNSAGVSVLCTSRLALERRGEALVRLGPLSFDDSVLLLEHHVRLLGVQIDESDRDAVEALSARLDGVPLAIELAASAVPSIGLQALLDLADNSGPPTVIDRRSDTPNRHRSIDAALQWNLDTIDDKTFRLLELCSSFDGEFDLAALVAVGTIEATDLLEMLGQLIDHSLVQTLRAQARLRYRVLVPIRDRVRSLHAFDDPERDQRFVTHYVDVVESGLSLVKGHAPMRGIEMIRADLANVRTAFDIADRTGDLDALSRLAMAVGFATAQTSSTNACATLRGWATRIADMINAGVSTSGQLEAALNEAYRGSGDWSRFSQIDRTSLPTDHHSLILAAIAANLSGESAAAFDILSRLDFADISDPFLRAMACGHGTLIAFANGSGDGIRYAEIASETARHSNSPTIEFYAEMAASTVSFFGNDVAALEDSYVRVSSALEGHGLVTLENLARLAKATFLGLGLGLIDPVPIFADMVGQFLEQNSLDPGAAVITIDSVTHVLFDAGRTTEAARLAGLAERLGVAFSPLDFQRSGLKDAIDADPALCSARRDGRLATSTDVLRSTHQTLIEMAAATVAATEPSTLA